MKFLTLLISLLFSSAVFSQQQGFNTFVNGLPAVSAPVGTESVPCIVGTVSSKCTAAGVANTATFTGDVVTVGGVATIQPGAITTSKLANIGASTILGNTTGSAAAPQALNPLAVAIQGSYGLTVHVSPPSGNITLSGTQTIDGASVLQGQSVLLTHQTTTSQNGIWIVQSGAWTRPVNFPTGYVIAANCTVDVFVEAGAVNVGHTFSLFTGSAVTIDSSAQTWNGASLPVGSPTSAGLVKITNSSLPAAGMGQAPSGLGGHIGDCANFTDTAGSVGDQGDFNTSVTNPCAFEDSNSHVVFLGSGTPPAVTGTGCSLTTGSTDQRGSIVATGADTCTLTYGAAFITTPFCVVAGYSATVLPYVSTASTTAAVIFKTAAAGTLSYACL
jgi:hypothetical protein